MNGFAFESFLHFEIPFIPSACRSTSANDDDDDLSKADAEVEAAVEAEAEAETEALPAQRRPETPAVLANEAVEVEDTESDEPEVNTYSQKNSPIPPTSEIVFVVARCFAPCAFTVQLENNLGEKLQFFFPSHISRSCQSKPLSALMRLSFWPTHTQTHTHKNCHKLYIFK